MLNLCEMVAKVLLKHLRTTVTAWKLSKDLLFSGPYFALFGLNTEIYSVNFCIQSEYREIGLEKTRIEALFTLCLRKRLRLTSSLFATGIFYFRYRLSAGTSEKIQLSSLIAAFQCIRDSVAAQATWSQTKLVEETFKRSWNRNDVHLNKMLENMILLIQYKLPRESPLKDEFFRVGVHQQINLTLIKKIDFVYSQNICKYLGL